MKTTPGCENNSATCGSIRADYGQPVSPSVHGWQPIETAPADWQPMGICIHCGAPIFTSDEPVEGQPCLDCIFDGTAGMTDKEQARAASQFLLEAEIIIPPAPDETKH